MSRACTQCFEPFEPRATLEFICPSCVVSAAAPARITSERAPSARQVYLIAHLALERLGIPWPKTRADVNAVLQRLRGDG